MRKKYLFYTLFLGFLTIIMCPKVFAEEVSVKVKTNPSSPDVLVTLTAEKNVTTVAQIRIYKPILYISAISFSNSKLLT